MCKTKQGFQLYPNLTICTPFDYARLLAEKLIIYTEISVFLGQIVLFLSTSI